jgi:hypothetical protein
MSLEIPSQHLASIPCSLSNLGLLLNASNPLQMTLILQILKTKPLWLLLLRTDQMRIVMLWRSVTKKYDTFNLNFSTMHTNNSQLAEMLLSKTIPEIHGKCHTLKLKTKAKATMAPPKKKARACSVEVKEIEDEDSPHNTAMRNATISLTSSFQILNSMKLCYLSCYVY